MAKEDKRANKDLQVDPTVSTVLPAEVVQQPLQYAGVSYDQSLANLGSIVNSGEDLIMRSAQNDRAIEKSNFLYDVEQKRNESEAQINVNAVKAEIESGNYAVEQDLIAQRKIQAKTQELQYNNDPEMTTKLKDYGQTVLDDAINSDDPRACLDNSGIIKQNIEKISGEAEQHAAAYQFDQVLKAAVNNSQTMSDNIANNVYQGADPLDACGQLVDYLRGPGGKGLTADNASTYLRNGYASIVGSRVSGLLEAGYAGEAQRYLDSANSISVKSADGTVFPLQLDNGIYLQYSNKVSSALASQAAASSITPTEFKDNVVKPAQYAVEAGHYDQETINSKFKEMTETAGSIPDPEKKSAAIRQAADFYYTNTNNGYLKKVASIVPTDELQRMLTNVNDRIHRYNNMSREDVISDLIHNPQTGISNVKGFPEGENSLMCRLRAPISVNLKEGQIDGLQDLYNVQKTLTDILADPAKYRTADEIDKYNSGTSTIKGNITKNMGSIASMDNNKILTAVKSINELKQNYGYAQVPLSKMNLLPDAVVKTIDADIDVIKKKEAGGYTEYHEYAGKITKLLSHFDATTQYALANQLNKSDNQLLRGSMIWSADKLNERRMYEFNATNAQVAGFKDTTDMAVHKGFQVREFNAASALAFDNMFRKVGIVDPNDKAFITGVIKQSVMGAFIGNENINKNIGSTANITAQVAEAFMDNYHKVDGHYISKQAIPNPAEAQMLGKTASKFEDTFKAFQNTGSPHVSINPLDPNRGMQQTMKKAYDASGALYHDTIDGTKYDNNTFGFKATQFGVVLTATVKKTGVTAPVVSRMGTPITISNQDLKTKPNFCSGDAWSGFLVSEVNAKLHLERTITELESKTSLTPIQQKQLEFAKDVHEKMSSPDYRANRTQYFNDSIKHEIQDLGRPAGMSGTLGFLKEQNEVIYALTHNIHNGVNNPSGNNGTPHGVGQMIKGGVKEFVNNALSSPAGAAEFDTKLNPTDEAKYQTWNKDMKSKGYIHPQDQGQDYDLRGAFKAGINPSVPGAHWPDTYKKPNHETFSNESQYAKGEYAKYAGSWKGDKFTPPSERFKSQAEPTGQMPHTNSHRYDYSQVAMDFYNGNYGKYYNLADTVMHSNNSIRITPFVNKPAKDMNKNDIYTIVKGACKQWPNVDPLLAMAVIQQESGFQTSVKSGAGAMGLMQLMPATAKGLKVRDPLDPNQNIQGGVKHLNGLLAKYRGNVILALAAYNAGGGAVDKYGGVPPYKETQNYVKSIQAIYKRNKQIYNYI